MGEEFKRALNRVINTNYLGLFRSEVTMKDLERYRTTDNGLVIINEIIEHNTRTYSVVCIDHVSHIIHCCSTDGGIMNCDAFRTLCELNDMGQYFRCIQYRYRCEHFHEGFAVYLVDLFTNQSQNCSAFFIDRVPSDGEIIELYELGNLYNRSTRLRH